MKVGIPFSFCKTKSIDRSLSFLIQQNPCSKLPCSPNGKCQIGFTDEGYRCKCHAGFTGQTCDQCKKKSILLKTLLIFLELKVVSGHYRSWVREVSVKLLSVYSKIKTNQLIIIILLRVLLLYNCTKKILRCTWF